MKTIVKHIEYLLSRTDCVIIPGFGAVLAHQESARFDFEAGVAYPPRRIFTFNGSLTVSDGSLAGSIARTEEISINAATDRITSEVDSMLSSLRANGSLLLGRIGSVSMQPDGAMHFNPAINDTVSAATAWLPTVEPAKQHEETKPVATDAPSATPVSLSPMVRFARVAASIALLFAIYFVASTPISIDKAALAALTPEIKHTPIEEFMPADIQPASNMKIYAAHNPEAIIAVDAIPGACYASALQLRNAGNFYVVVVGSCASLAEAEKFIEIRKDFSLRFIEQDGRFRVFSAAFASESEAYSHISKANYGSGGAWVCHIR